MENKFEIDMSLLREKYKNKFDNKEDFNIEITNKYTDYIKIIEECYKKQIEEIDKHFAILMYEARDKVGCNMESGHENCDNVLIELLETLSLNKTLEQYKEQERFFS